jgi:hypothetical protein
LHLRAAAPPIPTPKLCFTRLASHANAQVSAGLSEMNVNGSLTVQSPEEGDSFTIMQLQLRYGYFLTPAIQVGALASAIKFEDEDTFGDVEAFGAYHFGAPGSMMVPYVGAHVGTGFGFDDNPLAFGGFADIKYFLGHAGAVSPELFATRSTTDNINWTHYGLRVGVSVFLGGS